MDMTILLAVILAAVILFSFFKHRADAKRIERLEKNQEYGRGNARPGPERPAALPEPSGGESRPPPRLSRRKHRNR
jgi:hypothetical protein